MSATAIRIGTERETVSLSEAAWIVELSAKTINTTIDRGEIELPRPKARAGAKRKERCLSSGDVLYLALRKQLGDLLSSTAKCELYEEVKTRKWILRTPNDSAADFEIVLGNGLLKVEVKQTCARIVDRWCRVAAAREAVASDPAIRGGEPVIRGTRIPVYMLADLVSQGASEEELLEDYPRLTAAKLKAALSYAETHPKRGRPRSAPWHK